jgi:hypothetical protein
VEINSGSFTETYSDKRGEFMLQGLRSGGDIPFYASTMKRDMEAFFTVRADSVRMVDVVLHPVEYVTAEGVVVDGQGKPVPGIPVDLNFAEDLVSTARPAVAVTDGDGRFRMDGIRAGRHYRFSVRDDQASSKTFLAGKNTGSLRIELPLADRWLEGTVRDAGGKPLAGMKVDAWGKGHAQTVTGRDGRFRLEGLTAERLELYFRGVPGLFQFQDVATNQPRDFTLPTGRHYLSGRVTDTRGKPLAGMFVKIARGEGERRPITVETDSGGHFHLSDLGQAEVTATAGGPGYREQTLRLRTDREDVRFRLDEAEKK